MNRILHSLRVSKRLRILVKFRQKNTYELNKPDKYIDLHNQ